MKYFLFVAFLTSIIFSEIKGCDKITTPRLVWRNNKGYHFGTYAKLNWYNAFQTCSYLGMQLLTIDSLDELKFIAGKILSSVYVENAYWTSGTDNAHEGIYIWMSTGETIPKVSPLWGISQPDNWKDNENCLSLNYLQSFQLNDDFCTTERYFICETTLNC